MSNMTPKRQRFIEEYLVDLNATAAAIRAGYSAKTAKTQACEMLAIPEVAAAVKAAQDARSKRTEITQDMVLQEFWAIATADPNELVQFRRKACQHCHPEGDATEEPNPDCDQCGGEGQGSVFVEDTRRLTGAARKLYAGVKVTKEGLEVKMHDKLGALTQVGRHLGMFTDGMRHTGADGGPIETVTRIELVGPPE